MSFTLPELPFTLDALEPHISKRTLEFHYGKHHIAYVDKANTFIQGTEFEDRDIEEIIQETHGRDEFTAIFNNAAQVWNHSFYWHCMKPGGGGTPSGEIAKKIDAAFGGYEKFVDEFKSTAASQFGSGWAWLVLNGDQLKITKTSNAHTPIAHNVKPLLTVDVWEHAYYLDCQNKRPKYLDVFVDHLLNWNFVAANLA